MVTSVAGNNENQLKVKPLWVCLRRQLKPIQFTLIIIVKKAPETAAFRLPMISRFLMAHTVGGERIALNSFQF